MELETERADALHELQFDEVMNIFGGRVVAHEGLARFGGVIGGDGVERSAESLAFTRSEDAAGDEGGCVGLAGSYLLREQTPIKDDGTLPAFEGGIERFAKAAGPHLCGILFVRHCANSIPLVLSYLRGNFMPLGLHAL